MENHKRKRPTFEELKPALIKAGVAILILWGFLSLILLSEYRAEYHRNLIREQASDKTCFKNEYSQVQFVNLTHVLCGNFGEAGVVLPIDFNATISYPR